MVGAYRRPTGEMVGFARAVSDGVSFGYLADVFVLAAARGAGLGLALVATITDDPRVRWVLFTDDAHGLYERFGFAAPDHLTGPVIAAGSVGARRAVDARGRRGQHRAVSCRSTVAPVTRSSQPPVDCAAVGALPAGHPRAGQRRSPVRRGAQSRAVADAAAGGQPVDPTPGRRSVAIGASPACARPSTAGRRARGVRRPAPREAGCRPVRRAAPARAPYAGGCW